MATNGDFNLGMTDPKQLGKFIADNFKDDKVDAGDMGAGHTVTAIYEITPAGAASSLPDPPRYPGNEGTKATPGKRSDELCFVKLRYKLPGESASRLIEQPVRAHAARTRFEAAPEDQRGGRRRVRAAAAR